MGTSDIKTDGDSQSEGEERVGFSVDTHIFRELGELLVGRDSTALAELIKNAYDADATKVTISGLNLGDQQKAVIRIVDNGNGMTPAVFREGFLRIAGRQKESGDRRSARFKRRFTGEKGIGRLAAHKIARVLRLASVPHLTVYPDALAVEARIDWDQLESARTLEDPKARTAIVLGEREHPGEKRHGTWIELTKLRRKWTEGQRHRLFAELNDFLIPPVLVNIDERVYAGKRLVEDLPVRDKTSANSNFELELADDFNVGESFWAAVVDQKAWLLEIDASSSSTNVEFLITPSRAAKLAFPFASSFRTSTAVNEDKLDGRPRFHARIVIREGQVRADGVTRSFAQSVFGVRVYVEGFRVAPYGESGNDWLHLDAEYTKRNRLSGDESLSPDTGLSSPYNRLVFGAVMFTQESAHPLRMLVNREGFVDDVAFDYVREVVQQGINFHTRQRASLTHSTRYQLDALEAPRLRSEFVVPAEAAQRLQISAESARSHAARAAVLLESGKTEEATKVVQEAARALTLGAANAGDLLSEVNQTRILASIGLQMGAFIHEVRSVQTFAASIRDEVHAALSRRDVRAASGVRALIAGLSRKLTDLSQMLERQATFLSDAISVDSRRRRSVQPLSVRLVSAINLLRPEIDRRHISVEHDISNELRTPAMFAAELTLILTNMLSNAVKAADDGGSIRCSATGNEDELRFVMENTGERIDLKRAERWFLPFESTSTSPGPTLGIGMGLGLPITRDMLGQYGGEIRFIPPSEGFATAIEFTLPRKTT